MELNPPLGVLAALICNSDSRVDKTAFQHQDLIARFNNVLLTHSLGCAAILSVWALNKGIARAWDLLGFPCILMKLFPQRRHCFRSPGQRRSA